MAEEGESGASVDFFAGRTPGQRDSVRMVRITSLVFSAMGSLLTLPRMASSTTGMSPGTTARSAVAQ